MCRNDASSWCYSLLTRQLVVASHLSELGQGEGIRPVPILPALYAVPFAAPVPLPRLASVAGMDVDLPRMGVSTGIGARDDLTHALYPLSSSGVRSVRRLAQPREVSPAGLRPGVRLTPPHPLS